MNRESSKISEARQNFPAQGGLRERKKHKNRRLIQREALRLIRTQGYEATTIRQICEAAEISESTFFRYFPSKEDIVRWDEYDPLILKAFQAQPPGLTAMAALRGAFSAVLTHLSAEERADLHERILLALSIPKAIGAEQLSGPMRSLIEGIAGRANRSSEDYEIQVLVGAVMGAGIVAMRAAAENPQADLVSLLDEAFARLEVGFSI